MATGTILLCIGAAVLPDGSSNNAAAGIQRVKSSGGVHNSHFLQATLDASTDEFLFWSFRMPVDYSSGLTLKAPYKMASATSGNVLLQAYVAAVSDGDLQDIDAKAFATVNLSAAKAVPGTAGYPDEIVLALTNDDGVVAGDWVCVEVGRDADNGSDTATGDMELLDCALEYTAA